MALTKNKEIDQILKRYKEISLLGKISGVLAWDLNVNLPPKAAQTRADQSAYLAKLLAEKWQDERFVKLIKSQDEKSPDLSLYEKAIIRNLKHAGKFYFSVPKEIIVEFAQTTSEAFMVWQEAKKNDDFFAFSKVLEKIVKLNVIIAEHVGYTDNLYDALLDGYEPGLTTKDCKNIFSGLQPRLTRLIKSVGKVDKKTKNLVESGIRYPIDDQRQVGMFILKKMGYDMEGGRMDVSSHPFTQELGFGDVRITNRYKEGDFVDSISVAMHEGGHALYEQGVDEKFENTPIAGGVSLGIHESQSRFWENQIGKSLGFVSFITPILQAFYPESLSKTSSETLFTLFNRVEPSAIRVEADEVTYNLHIAVRFELEEALVNNKIKVSELPQIWRQKMKKYLGIEPKDDREGVLQDVHWSYGSFGYFPTYTLGNLYAAQFTAAMKKDLDIETLTRKGELGTILSWLRTNVHRCGSLYWPNELVERVTGEKLSEKYFLDYLEKKYKR